MNKAGILETILGIVVVAVAAIFLIYAYELSGRINSEGSYKLSAVFGRIDGVATGAEVRIAGVKVGAVTHNTLDTTTYEARVDMAIDMGVQIPEDSVAKVVSDGLLGGAHIAIEPGGAEEMLVAGDAITITQGSVDLLGLAMQAFTSNGGGASDEGGAGQGTSAPAATTLDPLGEF